MESDLSGTRTGQNSNYTDTRVTVAVSHNGTHANHYYRTVPPFLGHSKGIVRDNVRTRVGGARPLLYIAAPGVGVGSFAAPSQPAKAAATRVSAP